MWTNRMQETLSAKKKGDVAFHHKDFRVAIECYSQSLEKERHLEEAKKQVEKAALDTLLQNNFTNPKHRAGYLTSSVTKKSSSTTPKTKGTKLMRPDSRGCVMSASTEKVSTS